MLSMLIPLIYRKNARVKLERPYKLFLYYSIVENDEDVISKRTKVFFLSSRPFEVL